MFRGPPPYGPRPPRSPLMRGPFPPGMRSLPLSSLSSSSSSPLSSGLATWSAQPYEVEVAVVEHWLASPHLQDPHCTSSDHPPQHMVSLSPICSSQVNPNSRPYPDHPPPPAPFLQTKAPLSLSQTLPPFTPSQVTGMLMAMVSQDSSGQDSALLTLICSGFLGQVRRLTL